MNKTQWRQAMRQKLEDWHFIQSQSGQLSKSLNGLHHQLHHLLLRQSGVWGSFRAHQLEPNISDCSNQSSHLTWVYPRMDGERLNWIQPGPNGFDKGSFGVEEPQLKGAQFVKLEQLNGILIPGVAFDKCGGRLGRGRGFFDKALANFEGLKIGIAWDIQVIEKVPNDVHDINMDFVVTEKQIFDCRQQITESGVRG